MDSCDDNLNYGKSDGDINDKMREKEQAHTMGEWAWVQIMRKIVWLRMSLPVSSITLLTLPQIGG